MSQQLSLLQKDYSYAPMPLYHLTNKMATDAKLERTHNKRAVKYRMDLNLYCVKKPEDTFFIRVENSHMIAWGIEQGDLLIVEQDSKIKEGDLLVVEEKGIFNIYEYFAYQAGEHILMSLDSRLSNLKLRSWKQAKIQGVVVNTVHQMRSRRAS